MAKDLDLQPEKPGLGKSRLVPGAPATRNWAPSCQKRGQEFGFRLPGMLRGPPASPLSDSVVVRSMKTFRVKRAVQNPFLMGRFAPSAYTPAMKSLSGASACEDLGET